MFLSTDSNPKNISIEKHYAIQVLSKELDLKHNCGYVTMMRISHSQAQKVGANSFSLKRNQDDLSLTSLNSLNDLSLGKKNSSGLAFNCTEENDVASKSIQESEWLLLDCAFGIPLFEGNLNKKVCKRLLDERLCSNSRYVSVF